MSAVFKSIEIAIPQNTKYVDVLLSLGFSGPVKIHVYRIASAGISTNDYIWSSLTNGPLCTVSNSAFRDFVDVPNYLDQNLHRFALKQVGTDEFISTGSGYIGLLLIFYREKVMSDPNKISYTIPFEIQTVANINLQYVLPLKPKRLKIVVAYPYVNDNYVFGTYLYANFHIFGKNRPCHPIWCGLGGVEYTLPEGIVLPNEVQFQIGGKANDIGDNILVFLQFYSY